MKVSFLVHYLQFSLFVFYPFTEWILLKNLNCCFFSASAIHFCLRLAGRGTEGVHAEYAQRNNNRAVVLSSAHIRWIRKIVKCEKNIEKMREKEEENSFRVHKTLRWIQNFAAQNMSTRTHTHTQ